MSKKVYRYFQILVTLSKGNLIFENVQESFGFVWLLKISAESSKDRPRNSLKKISDDNATFSDCHKNCAEEENKTQSFYFWGNRQSFVLFLKISNWDTIDRVFIVDWLLITVLT